MSVEQAVDMVREALALMLLLSTPVLAAGLVIGLAISLLQAVTQVQEQTLTFVPKIIGMVLVAMALTPWLAAEILEFSQRMFIGGG